MYIIYKRSKHNHRPCENTDALSKDHLWLNASIDFCSKYIRTFFVFLYGAFFAFLVYIYTQLFYKILCIYICVTLYLKRDM